MITSSAMVPRSQSLAATGKGKTLPIKRNIIIPAGLDFQLKAWLNSTLRAVQRGVYCTKSNPEDLTAIAAILGQSVSDAAYSVEMYGYEIWAFYAFLGERELWLDIWWPNAERDNQHRFLRQLRDILYSVDVHASRPIAGKG